MLRFSILLCAVALLDGAIVDRPDRVKEVGEEEVGKMDAQKTEECEFFDQSCARAREAGEDISSCFGSKRCRDQAEAGEEAGVDTEAFCYTVWQNGTGGSGGAGGTAWSIKRQGCLFNHGSSQDHCRNRSRCVEDSAGSNKHMFCCCRGNNCNRDFRWEPLPPETTPPPSLTAAGQQPSARFYLILYSVVPVLVVVVVGLAGAYIYRQRKSSQFSSLSQSDDGPISPPTPTLTRRPIQLLEIKARGRFGAVWKGQLGEELVAVKIFPLQDKQSWFAEQEIYNLPQMSHENVLKFMGVDRRGENLQTEFWLVTAFHERGSLCDYLKLNTVSLDELCRLSLGIAAGLTHLHTEIPAARGEGAGGIKPAIAHRDFKSKNVLIKSDMTACIGDFGLALQFKPNEIVGDTHGQVGTRRYMAPEVLEGAINFSRDAFLRIDMYACGLVLWEVAARCREIGPAAQYRLPFEAETSPHPTLEEISDLVVHRKIRPELRENWRKHEALSILCETIEECWDHDAEARLSASCVQERLQLMKSILNTMDSVNTEQDNRVTSQEIINNTLNSQLRHQPPPSSQMIMMPLTSIIENS